VKTVYSILALFLSFIIGCDGAPVVFHNQFSSLLGNQSNFFSNRNSTLESNYSTIAGNNCNIFSSLINLKPS
jgi:hypothetical protein